eukprot:g1598.t1
MAQGSGKLRRKNTNKNKRATKTKNKKLGAVAKKRNKHTKINPGRVIAVKKGRKVHGLRAQKRVTGMIKNNIEEIMAGKVIQAGGTFRSRDLKGKGKQKVKELHRAMREREVAKKRRYQQIKKIEAEIKQLDGDDGSEDEYDLDL